MTDHAMVAPRKRREEIAGQVHDAEKRVTKLHAALANLDAAIATLSPERPDFIAHRRS
jgi:F0F1-type ATP synthase membrane subunit b/b'